MKICDNESGGLKITNQVGKTLDYIPLKTPTVALFPFSNQDTVVKLEASPVVIAQDAKPRLLTETSSLVHTLEDLIKLMLRGIRNPELQKFFSLFS